jgi:hypothetical protein
LSNVAEAALGHQTSTSTLDEEGHDVTGNENLGDQIDADGRIFLSVDGADDASEDHVDGGCEECGCKKHKDALDNIWHKFASVVAGACPSGISNEFNCNNQGKSAYMPDKSTVGIKTYINHQLQKEW